VPYRKSSPTDRRLSTPGLVVLLVLAAIVVLFLAVGTATGGIGGLLVIAGLFAALFALWSLVTGRRGPLFLRSRGLAAGVLGIAVVATGLGGAILPSGDDVATAESSSRPASFAEAAPIPSPSSTAAAERRREAAAKKSAEASAKASAEAKKTADEAAAKVEAERVAAEQAAAEAAAAAAAQAEAERVAAEQAAAAQAEADRVAAAQAAAAAAAAAAAPAPAAPAAPSSTYYKNCDAVRAAGAAPIYAGQPGYASHLDRDGDGVGCEN